MNPPTKLLHIVPATGGGESRPAPPRARPPFGRQLWRLRRAAGLTQEALARRAGYSAVYIGMLERGERAPLPATVDVLAGALALAADEHAALHVAARGGGAQPLGLHLNTAALPPLVDRERELAALDRFLTAQAPPLLALCGEPGIGKTRLLYEALTRGAARGWTVMHAGCQRASTRQAYAPLLDALEGYMRAQAPQVLRTQLHGCLWLERVLPQLAEYGLSAISPEALPPERERRLLFGAVARFMENVAGPAGALLVLDNMQWAGPDALDLLATLLNGSVATPLRMAIAFRSTEIQQGDPLALALGDLELVGLLERHELAPLPPEGARRLLDGQLSGRPDMTSEEREGLVQRTGGVPFFIISSAQSLHSGASDALPWNLAQSIRQRITALPDATRAVLDTVAVFGRHAPRQLLHAVAAWPGGEVIGALEALCRARLLEEDGGGYRFVHDVIHDVVATDLAAARRLALHRRVAEAMENAPDERSAETIAFHYLRSDTPIRATPYLEEAGDQAHAAAAYTTAEAQYRALLDLLAETEQGPDMARAREKLGAAVLAAGRYDEAISHTERAALIYQALGDGDGLSRAVTLIAYAHGRRGAPAEGIARSEGFLPLLGPAPVPSRDVAALYAALAHLYFLSGRYANQLAAATTAARVARACGEQGLVAAAEGRRGVALFSMGRLDDALPVLREAADLAEAAGDQESLWRALNNISTIHFMRGEFAQCRPIDEKALLVTRRQNDPVSIARILSNRGDGALYLGEWAQARADFDEALALVRRVGDTEATVYPLLDLANLCLWEGRWEEMARYVDEALRLGERSGDLQVLRWAGGLLAERDILQGYPERACARFAPLLDRAGLEETDITYVLPVLAWAYLEAGEAARAGEVAAQALRRARAQESRVVLAVALRVRAMIACHDGDWGAALAGLEEGLAVTQSIPYPHAEARLRHVYADVYLGRDADAPGAGQEAARQHLHAALAIYTRLGAHADAARARDDLAALPYRRYTREIGGGLSHGQWARVQAVLPRVSRHGRPRADDRRALEAILYVRRSGCTWAGLPKEFGDDATAHRRYQQWQAGGAWARIARILELTDTEHASCLLTPNY